MISGAPAKNLANYIDVLQMQKTSATLMNSAVVGVASASAIVLFVSLTTHIGHILHLPHNRSAG